MKLLLTSNGLSNDSIANAFHELIGKEPKDTKVAFIPTAANIERGDKGWLIDDLYRVKSRAYVVDILEIASLDKETIKDVLEGSDVIFVGGGNTFYLSYWMQQKGLFELIPNLLQTKVYAGISAGSMIVGANMRMEYETLDDPTNYTDDYYDELGPEGQSSGKSLKLVNFLFRPHLNSEYFPKVRKELIEKSAATIPCLKIFALDDQSALKIVDDKVDVVTEGEWAVFNDN